VVYKRTETIEAIAKVWTELNVETHLDNANLEIESLNKTFIENERLAIKIVVR